MQTLPHGTESPLLWVGRKLKGLASKRSSVVVQIYGEAGIGKTRAVTQLLQITPFASVSKRAVTPIPELVRTLPKPKKLSAWLSHQLEKLEDNLQAAPIVAAYLEQLAPFVLHVEDIHECDEARVAIWQALIDSLQNTKGVGLLLTSRVKLEILTESIQLEPLNLQASTALLEKEIGAALPKEAGAWIYAKAAGNPLFTLEYFRHLARQGFLWNDGLRWYWRFPNLDVLPTSVEALIERTISEVCTDENIRRILEVRAYLESQVPHLKLSDSDWLHLTELDTGIFEICKTQLETRGVLNDRGFVHPLFREVPFKTLSKAKRQTTARLALQILPLESAAVFVEDANLGAEQSVKFLLGVAQNSKQTGYWLARAVHYANGTERIQLALEAARALAQSDVGQTEKLYRLVLEENTDELIMLEFIEFLSRHQFEQAKTLFESLPENHRMSLQGLMARISLMNVENDFYGILKLWEETGSSSDLEPDLLVHVIWALKTVARFDEAINLADRVLFRTDLTPWQRARVLNRKSSVYGASNRYKQALEITEQILDLLNTHKLMGQDVILYDRALYHKQLGDYSSAKQSLEQSLSPLIQTGRVSTQMHNRGFLGSVCYEFGDYETAEELLLQAYEYQKHEPPNQYTADTLHNLTELYVGWEIRPLSSLLAQKYAHLALEYAETLKIPTYLAAADCFAGFVELHYGHAEKALEFALRALALRVEGDSFFGLWFPTWLKAKAQAKLGKFNDTEKLLVCVISAFKNMGRGFEANQATLDLLRLQNNVAKARTHLEWFQERGLRNAFNAGLRLFPELRDDQQPSETRVSAQLQVLGAMQIAQNSVSISVKGQKRKELLARLLEARVSGRHEIKTFELLDALYPNSLEEEGLSALKQNVFKTRAAHGSSIITTTTNGYALGSVSSDAEEFLKHPDTKLWRGAFLDGLSASDEVRETLSQSCQNQAQKILETEPKEAARVLRLLLESDPYNLEILKLTCRALRFDNNHRTLQRLFTESRARLLEVGEVLPETWQEFLL